MNMVAANESSISMTLVQFREYTAYAVNRGRELGITVEMESAPLREVRELREKEAENQATAEYAFLDKKYNEVEEDLVKEVLKRGLI